MSEAPGAVGVSPPPIQSMSAIQLIVGTVVSPVKAMIAAAESRKILVILVFATVISLAVTVAKVPHLVTVEEVKS